MSTIQAIWISLFNMAKHMCTLAQASPGRGAYRALAVGLISLSMAACWLPSSARSPAAAPAPASAPPGRYAVLFDASHGETAGNADWVISASRPDPLAEHADPRRETDWTGALSAWGVALHNTGRYQLMTLPRGERISYGDRANRLDLANFNVFVVPEPNIRFTQAEKTAIIAFVQNGGGLFMIANHDQSDRNSDGMDSLRIWNDLIGDSAASGGYSFGFRFDMLNIGSDNPRDIPPSAAASPVLRGPFGNVIGSSIRAGTTATIQPADNPSVQALIYRSRADTGGTTGVFFLTSVFGKGRVAAWGDSSPIDDGSGADEQLFDGWSEASGSNAILALNATEWLAQGGTSALADPTLPLATAPAAASAPEQAQLRNGDFERGQAGWRAQAAGGRQIVGGARPHSGDQSAGLCGYNDCDEALAQSISLPQGARTIGLSYYTYITTEETRHAFDFLTVELREPGGRTLQTLERLNDGSPADRWRQSSFDLSGYAGQTVELVFRASCGRVRPSEFFVDDIEISIQ
jgi:hypothetical protein